MAGKGNPKFGARIPQDWVNEFEALAKASGRTPADLAREAFAAYLGKPAGSSAGSEVEQLNYRLSALEAKVERFYLTGELNLILERLQAVEQAIASSPKPLPNSDMARIAPIQSTLLSRGNESPQPGAVGNQIQATSFPSSIDDDDIYDEPDEILYDFLYPAPPPSPPTTPPEPTQDE